MRARQRSLTRDRGSGTVAAVGLMAAIAALMSLALPIYGALVVKQSVAAAADAGALAAADAASGVVAGYPCEVAARVARANAASVTACEVDGLIVTVSVSRYVLGIGVAGRATAGPG